MSKITARGTYLPPYLGFVVKHIDAIELRVVVAVVLAVAADAVLVAHLARLSVHNLARRSGLAGGWEHAREIGGRSGET